MNILVPNLGSTSLKYQVLEMPGERILARGRYERVADYRTAIEGIRAGDTRVDAVAFKAVHGGPKYRGTFVIDDDVVAAQTEFLLAAPLHNRIYLDAIAAFRDAMPGVPLVAAFETEFHRTIPDSARWYGVPSEWRTQYGVERYGFHGASHQFVAGRAPVIAGLPQTVRIVSCHLGGSSSICAIEEGRSVDTTMGFSPQSGLENATRHGDLDPFAVLYMMDRAGWSTSEVREQLAQVSGLAGISGVAGGDCRDIEASAVAGNQNAALALEIFTLEVRKTIGAYAAAMGGLDLVAFTGGIGENSANLRERCCRGLEFLGIRLDCQANQAGPGDRVVSKPDSQVKVVAMTTNEELIVARRAYRTLSQSA